VPVPIGNDRSDTSDREKRKHGESPRPSGSGRGLRIRIGTDGAKLRLPEQRLRILLPD
jgi:hypothetical protein